MLSEKKSKTFFSCKYMQGNIIYSITFPGKSSLVKIRLKSSVVADWCPVTSPAHTSSQLCSCRTVRVGWEGLVSMALDWRSWHAAKSFLMHDIANLMLSWHNLADTVGRRKTHCMLSFTTLIREETRLSSAECPSYGNIHPMYQKTTMLLLSMWNLWCTDLTAGVDPTGCGSDY